MNIKFENDKTKNETIKVLCSSCKNNTNHNVLTSINEIGTEPLGEYYSIDWNTDYEIIQCLGCERISFRNHSTNSENTDYQGRPISTTLIYPKRSKDTIAAKHYFNVPYNLQRIYSETVESYNYGNLTLCGAGVRALVEGVCKENGITEGNVEFKNKDGSTVTQKKTNLQGKINGLHESGKLTLQHSEILHEHRFLGNEAIHELSLPSKEDLYLAIEIVENVFDTLYEIPSKGLELKSKRLKK
ncbi:DUF4145 domain-containing protein [Polaribacter butkevichii]|uniref:DUF4145 domain-containing protein n=1 Tax=Polaribacter butkevichii TaxID=218490 RepID=A0A2P6CFD2_9FLAO|nr:DUF4145 domain-containing protein [Polaribacter butkevichii]PQJ73615.1 hypothetical protein BTO14_10200 [Polaribacter butkevichii]